jgi:hypothetical protein
MPGVWLSLAAAVALVATYMSRPVPKAVPQRAFG